MPCVENGAVHNRPSQLTIMTVPHRLAYRLTWCRWLLTKNLFPSVSTVCQIEKTIQHRICIGVGTLQHMYLDYNYEEIKTLYKK